MDSSQDPYLNDNCKNLFPQLSFQTSHRFWGLKTFRSHHSAHYRCTGVYFFWYFLEKVFGTVLFAGIQMFPVFGPCVLLPRGHLRQRFRTPPEVSAAPSSLAPLSSLLLPFPQLGELAATLVGELSALLIAASLLPSSRKENFWASEGTQVTAHRQPPHPPPRPPPCRELSSPLPCLSPDPYFFHFRDCLFSAQGPSHPGSPALSGATQPLTFWSFLGGMGAGLGFAAGSSRPPPGTRVVGRGWWNGA